MNAINFITENLRKDETIKYSSEQIDYVIEKYLTKHLDNIYSIYDFQHPYFNVDYMLSILGSVSLIGEDLTEEQKKTMALNLSNLQRIKGTKKAIQYILRILNLDAEIYEWYDVNYLNSLGDPNFPDPIEECSIIILAEVSNFSIDSDLNEKLQDLFRQLLWSCVILAEFRWTKAVSEDVDFSSSFDLAIEEVAGECFNQFERIIRDFCPELPHDFDLKVICEDYYWLVGDEVFIPDFYIYGGENWDYTNRCIGSCFRIVDSLEDGTPDDETLIIGPSVTWEEYQRIAALNNGEFPCDFSNFDDYEEEYKQENLIISPEKTVSETVDITDPDSENLVEEISIRSYDINSLPPLDPYNLRAVFDPSTRRINLTWLRRSTDEIGFIIERSASNILNFNQIGQVGNGILNFSDTSATEGENYYYRVYAFNSHGSSGYTNMASVFFPILVPTAPINLDAAYNYGTDSINVTWTNTAVNADILYLERSIGNSTNFVVIATLSPGTTIYNDTEMYPQNHFYYRIRAWNEGGYSNYSNIDVTWCPVPLPDAPSNFTATYNFVDRNELTWDIGAENVDNYIIERSIDSTVNYVQLVIVDGATTAWDDLNPDNGHIYYYRIRSSNITGYSDYLYDFATIPLPDAPSNFNVEYNGSDRNTLTWTFGENYVDNYIIERSVDNEDNYTEVITVSSSYDSWIDIFVSGGHIYYYRICSSNTVGISEWLYGNETIPLEIPTNLTVTDIHIENEEVSLEWDDNSTDEIQFRIERQREDEGSFTEIATVPVNTTTYVDDTVTSGYLYTYRVRAYSGSIFSEYSNTDVAELNPSDAFPNLINYWKFNEGSGNEILDYHASIPSTGNSWNLVPYPSGDIQWDTLDGVNGCVEFNNYRVAALNYTYSVDLYPSTQPQQYGGNYTIEFRTALNSGCDGVIMHSGRESSSYWGIHIIEDSGGSTSISLTLRDNSSATNDTYTYEITPVWNPGEWHHIAYTFDRANGNLQLYIDSVLAQTFTGINDTGIIGDGDPQYSRFGMGGGPYVDTSRNYNGKVDEVRIWGEVRSQSDIQHYMNRSLY